MKPSLIKGSQYSDHRGIIQFNNSFDASEIKRVYFIENIDSGFVRAWQGHQIEQRWFSAVNGTFRIQLIKIDQWENPTENLEKETFILKSEDLTSSIFRKVLSALFKPWNKVRN